MNDKRGLSAIITTLLVVVLVLVAIGIVWGVVSGLLRSGAEDIELSAKCLNIDVRATIIDCNTNPACLIKLIRTGSNNEEIGGVKLVFFEGTVSSGVIDKKGNVPSLVGKSLVGDNPLDEPDLLEVTPYILSSSGKEKLCSTTSSNIVAGIAGGGEIGDPCGNGECISPETCNTCPDDCGVCGGGDNGGGAICGDESCNGDEICGDDNVAPACYADCGPCPGGDEEDCGNGYCDAGETYETCPDDCPVLSSCDGIWNPPEDVGIECDGGVGCTDCICDAGYVPADPLGPDCEVDLLTDCGDGTFDSEHEQCDDSDPSVPEDECIEPGEPNECTCPDGYDPDEIGGCIQRVALVTGTVDEVWPTDSVMYFASDSLPKDEGNDILYTTGYYVKFPGSVELDCVLIANYVIPFGSYTMSHIAFNYEVDIIVGDDYEIWGDFSCS